MVREWMIVSGTTVSWHNTSTSNVKGIVILSQRLRDESIISRIVHGGVENAVEFDQATGFIQFVLDAGSKGNLDQGLNFLGAGRRRE